MASGSFLPEVRVILLFLPWLGSLGRSNSRGGLQFRGSAPRRAERHCRLCRKVGNQIGQREDGVRG